jgi:hypothetical protein
MIAARRERLRALDGWVAGKEAIEFVCGLLSSHCQLSNHVAHITPVLRQTKRRSHSPMTKAMTAKLQLQPHYLDFNAA